MIPKGKKGGPRLVAHLRPIALTPIFSKVLEGIVRLDILDDIRAKLDGNQYGGMKGSSPEHYMSGLLQDIFNMKEKNLVPVLLMWDFSAAFTSMQHQQVLASAADLNLRQPLLRLLASYLSGRTTVVRWGEAASSARPCRGGSGQGTLLSVILFVIAVDQLIKQLKAKIRELEGPVQHDGVAAVRLFVDDSAVLLTVDPAKLPVDAQGRRVWRDVDGRVAAYCSVVESFSASTGMRLNQSKTEALVFDPSIVFPLELRPDKNGVRKPVQILESALGQKIVRVPSAKLLGIVLETGLKFNDFVAKKTSSAHKALWGLRRIKQHKVTAAHLTSAYISYVCSTLEFGMSAIWPCLTRQNVEALERVQKQATKIILDTGWTPVCPNYVAYEERLRRLGLQKLSDRWQETLNRFALKIEFDDRFSRYIQRRFVQSLRDPAPYFLTTVSSARSNSTPLRAAIRYLNSLQTSPEKRKAAAAKKR